MRFPCKCTKCHNNIKCPSPNQKICAKCIKRAYKERKQFDGYGNIQLLNINGQIAFKRV